MSYGDTLILIGGFMTFMILIMILLGHLQDRHRRRKEQHSQPTQD